MYVEGDRRWVPLNLHGGIYYTTGKAVIVPGILHGLCNIANGFVQNIHHTSVSPAIFIINKAVLVGIPFWDLEWNMDILECHIQKQGCGRIM